LIAPSYNRGNLLQTNYVLQEITGNTTTILAVELASLAVGSRTTNGALIEQALFSGIGISNIVTGNIILKNLTNSTVPDISIPLSNEQIIAINSGNRIDNIILTNLNSDINYQIRFEFYDLTNTPMTVIYNTAVAASQSFLTLKDRPTLNSVNVNNGQYYFEKAVPINFNGIFTNRDSAVISHIMLNGT